MRQEEWPNRGLGLLLGLGILVVTAWPVLQRLTAH